ncbi:MAG TPA: flagellar basal body P-ring protein FlgI [Gammaproteobacteria bacterium]|nr:flagellar basal body P-ring protein FlgI [Gammaproteobacteria bacterium]
MRCKFSKGGGLIAGLILTLIWAPGIAQAERIKDLAQIAGVRSNQLVGYGLVVGLSGTGDQTTQTPFTLQSMKNMLNQFGINVPPNINPQLKNVAAVTLHAELPPFAKPGQTIDVTVSSIGNAKSLLGGSLLMAPLKGADGKVYALAQGNLVVGGFGVEADGSSITLNIPNVGRIPNGATVERGVVSSFANGNSLIFNLNTPDFTTANRIAQAINRTIGPQTAQALDGASVQVAAPRDMGQRVAFMSLLENIEVSPGEAAAKIVVNSRTGTIIIGKNVRVSPAAVTHGGMMVTITARPEVSQPAPGGLLGGAAGQTVVVPRTEIAVEQKDSRMFKFAPGVSLDEIVRAVNEVGAAPGDLVAILEALKEAGALSARLIVI